jgi:prepilin-type N-terminal cleavage/methylation domain-containing protein
VSLTARRGVSLAELLVALVLLGLLGAVMTQALLRYYRATHAALEREAARRTVEQATMWLTAELGELGRDSGAVDLYRIAAESITYRAPRSVGLGCVVAPDEVRLLLDRSRGWRQPQAGRDSMLLLAVANLTGQADRWLALPITGASLSACGGRPAIRLATRFPPGRSLPADSAWLYPIRVFEMMQAKLYRSQGAWWLGARSESAGEGVQPLAGPLTPGGLRLVYRDSVGGSTTLPRDVRQIELHVRAGEAVVESATVTLRPRNLQ